MQALSRYQHYFAAVGLVSVHARPLTPSPGDTGRHLLLEYSMEKHIRLRDRAFREQLGCCFYCKVPMWLRDPTSYLRTYAVPRNCVRLLQCTAEHLRPISERGRDAEYNIVAACAFCISTRHRARKVQPADRFTQLVRRPVAKGQWHTREISRSIASVTKEQQDSDRHGSKSSVRS